MHISMLPSVIKIISVKAVLSSLLTIFNIACLLYSKCTVEESDKEKAYEMFIGDFQRETDLRFDEVTIAQGGLVVLLVLLSKTLFCYSLYSILK